jgi:vancomycin resistance protein YoaR
MRTLMEQLLRNRVWAGLGLAAIVLVVVYGGLATFLAGHVASNVTVDGVAIGGMTSGEATATLQNVMDTKVSRPVRLTVPSRTVEIQPAEAGLQIDVAATVAGLTAFTVNPMRLWSHLAGTENQPLKFHVDRAKLTAAVTKAAGSLNYPMKEGSITFTGDGAVRVVSVVGTKVRVPETADAVAAAWPRQQDVPAVTTLTPPKASAEEITRATRAFATPAMSAPVRVVGGSQNAAGFTVRPRQYAGALSMTLDGTGRLQPRVDGATLMRVIRAIRPGVEHPGVDATVRLAGGRPQIVPAVSGTKVDARALSAAFLAALTSPERTVTITSVPSVPKVTTAVAQGWRITAPISTFTTQFPVNPPRTNNIKIAAAALNGTLVRPGGQFSLNATLGERTPAKGYEKAPVIYGGRLVSDYGGGVSQVSTATYNAAFFAGVRIDQHLAHSFYISRYPEGREATVSWPDVDQKWTNDTGAGILVQASVSGSDLTVTLWGTKKWDIKAVKGPRRNIVEPKVIVDAKANCVPQAPTPGFDVTVTQIFSQNGAQVRTVGFNTHYIPEDTVTCSHATVTP